MELRQLEYFVAVAEEANFTRAAQRVHISQSGVSAQIRQLERELGHQLFDRSSRIARLTAAGEAALEPARTALAAATSVQLAVDEVAGLLRGRLSIGMVVGCTISPLFDAMEKFHRDHPGVEMSVHEGNSEQMIAAIRSGELDIALIGVAGSPPDGLEALTLVSEPLGALVPRGHPLADRKRIAVNDLAGEPIVSMPVGTGIRAALDIACATAGFTPDISIEASAADAVADFVERGLGIGVLSASMTSAYRDRLPAVRLTGTPLPALLAVVWTPSQSPALRGFLPRLREAFSA
ncbi:MULTISPECIES: LysR family transcriptional regulator [unclassified Mycobacterium]|uniref:LysR family transcriptional regulator n=1 Tax=unclassified Mycobacterium TaxID=2642494 RepID=UPI0029C91D24|nr:MULTISPECIES: LysR substrate-binding domain-containing protein [unclassified Mycobacterium]